MANKKTSKTKKAARKVKEGLAVAATVATLACTKVEQGEQTISLSIGGVRTGTICKGATDILSSTAPTGIPTLTLTSEDGEHIYTVTPGEAVSVRLGKYTVTGAYIPDALSSIPSFGFAYAEPRYKVKCEIEVVEGTSEYEVSASYTCWALLIDYASTEKYRCTDAAGNWADVGCLTKVGDYGVAYIWSAGASAKNSCSLSAVPVDTETYDETTYTICWNGSTGVVVENGKWYMFSAGEAARESGDIAIGLPEWEDGNE